MGKIQLWSVLHKYALCIFNAAYRGIVKLLTNRIKW